jgi:type IV pilus assembly protein PilA
MKGRRTQSGFTFIELMSVVMIIGVLASIIMPAVKNYSARAKVSEALLALTTCRNTVAEVYLSTGDTLPGADNWGCESGNSSKYVESIHTTDVGVIKVRISPAVGDGRIANADITLAPINRANQVMSDDDVGSSVFRWRCGSSLDGTDLDLGFLPSSCRGF